MSSTSPAFAKALDQVPVSASPIPFWSVSAALRFCHAGVQHPVPQNDFGPWQFGGLIFVAVGIFALAQGR